MDNKKADLTWITLKQLAMFVQPYKGWVALGIGATMISAIVDVLSGYFIKVITDSALNGQQVAIVDTIYLILLTVIIGIVVKYGVKYCAARFSAYALRDIRSRITAHVAHFPYATIESRHSGDMVSRLTNDVGTLQSFFQSDLANTIYQPILFLATFSYMATISWKLLIVAIAVMPVTTFLTNLLSKPLSKWAGQRLEGFGMVNEVAQDVIGGIYMQKAYNLNGILLQKFKVAVDQILNNRLKFEMRHAVMDPLFIATGAVPVLATGGYGGYLAIQGELTPGGLFAFIYLLYFITGPLTILTELLANVRSAAAAGDRIMAVLHQPRERSAGRAFAVMPSENMLECRSVAFAYPEQRGLLNNLSFAIPAKSTVAFVGHSGSGKSTIFKLVCGFYEPQVGSIRLYGHDLRQWDIAAMRQNIALVSQDTYLFPGTVAENIALGHSEATLDEIMAAAQTANAHDFILDLPEGYSTPVGERGNRLSGGERQRLQIARAILKDAPILLLDEPTSALDTHSETLVRDALERFMPGRTVLVIAHRMSTVKGADEILVLDQGAIVERGKHNDLINQNGLYKQLYAQQFAQRELSEGG